MSLSHTNATGDGSKLEQTALVHMCIVVEGLGLTGVSVVGCRRRASFMGFFNFSSLSHAKAPAGFHPQQWLPKPPFKLALLTLLGRNKSPKEKGDCFLAQGCWRIP